MKVNFTSILWNWYPHPELNRDQRFRKPPLYPFELWGQAPRKRGILLALVKNDFDNLIPQSETGRKLLAGTFNRSRLSRGLHSRAFSGQDAV